MIFRVIAREFIEAPVNYIVADVPFVRGEGYEAVLAEAEVEIECSVSQPARLLMGEKS